MAKKITETKKQIIIVALEELENRYHNENGYDVGQILTELNLTNQITEKTMRGYLRLMMDKNIPDINGKTWNTAGDEDIVYEPKGKNSGYYRLSKYRKI